MFQIMYGLCTRLLLLLENIVRNFGLMRVAQVRRVVLLQVVQVMI